MKNFHWIYIIMLLLIFILLVLIRIDQKKVLTFTDWMQVNYNSPYEETCDEK